MKNITIFFGEENLSIKKRINRIIHEVKSDDLNTILYDLEVDSLDKMLDDCYTIPFMADVKCVICKNPVFITNKYKESLKELEKYLQKIPEYTYLLINAGTYKLDESNEVINLLKKKSEIVYVKKPTDIEMNGWLKMQCNFSGVDINSEAIKEFFTLVSNTDLSKCKCEVEKLINYVGKGNVIKASDVRNLVVRNLETDVFKLTGAIFDKNRKKAYEIYLDLISLKYDIVNLINLIATSLKNTYLVKELINQKLTQDMISEKLKLKQGYVYNLINQSKKLTMQEVKKQIVDLALVDFDIKSGKQKPKDAFENYLLKI